MTQEIERKFLIINVPDNLLFYNSYTISQGYILITDDIEIRLRKKGDKYFQTIKSTGDLSREEYEIELTQDQFEVLWPLTAGKRIKKLRHEIKYDDYIIELDIYHDSLEGLKTAEVEFKNFEEGESFKPPEWFDAEITYNKMYKNKNLSIFGLPD